jgi:hypothetical protein
MNNERTRDIETDLESFDLPEEVKARIRRIAAGVIAANPELLRKLPLGRFVPNDPAQ